MYILIVSSKWIKIRWSFVSKSSKSKDGTLRGSYWKNKIIQALINCAPDPDRSRSGAQKLWDEPDLLGAHILLCKKEKKSLDPQIYSWIDKTMKKIQ